MVSVRKPTEMKPLLQYGLYGRLARKNDQDVRIRINENDERSARIREGVAMKNNLEVHPSVFACYGNGPFIMPSLYR